MQAYYNIHDIVKVLIRTKRPQIIEEYDYYLRHFKVLKPHNLDDVTIEVKDIEEFSLPADALNIHGELFGFKDGVYNQRDSYAVKLSNNKMELFIKDNDLGINTFIEYFLLQRQTTLIHGAAVSYNGKGIIFPAPPNVGKTLLVSKLRNNPNVKFFGDDYAAVGADKTLLCYPMDFSIYSYHFDFFPELKNSAEQLKIKKAFFERIIVDVAKNLPIKKALKNLARVLGYDFLKGGQYLKVPAARLIPKEKFGEVAPLNCIVFLHKYNGKEFKVQALTPEYAAKEIIGILQSEWEGTLPVYHALSTFGVIDFAKYLGDIKQVIVSAFQNLKIYNVLMPTDMQNEARMEKLEAFLEKEIFKNL